MKNDHIVTIIESHLQYKPDKVAVVCGNQWITYSHLLKESGKLANYLQDKVKPNQFVLIMLERSHEFVLSLLALLRCGCIFVPIDPGNPKARIHTLFKEVGVKWLITTSTYKQMFEDIIITENLEVMIMDDAVNPWDSYNSNFPNIYGQHGYIFFTSGSSGIPKGVLGRHRSLLHFVNWEINEFSLDENVRVSQLTNPSFDQILRDIFMPLVIGGTCCIPEHRDIIFNPGKLVNWLDKNRVSLIHMVPSYFKAVSQAVKTADCLLYVKTILLAGELIRGNDIRKFIETFGARIQLVNFYGATETTLIKTFYRIKESDVNLAVIPAGRPIADTQIMILDKSLNKCLIHNVGEVYIRTPFISSGYFNNRELTKKVFIKNPFSEDPRDIIYKTGDLGRINYDGNLELLGRIDSQVKIRGIRVELGEIEDTLLNYNDINEAIVLSESDEQNNNYLIAFLVVGKSFGINELRRYLKSNLPESMIPSQFRRVERIPLSPNGKVDRSALLAGKSESFELESTYVEPKKGLERTIADIWKEILKIDRIGIHDSFFELGANSMHLITVNSKIKEILNKDIPVVTLLANPTVSELTRYLQEETITEKDIKILPRRSQTGKEIAIIGMAGRFPGADDIESFWNNLKNGVESISFFTDSELEGTEIDPLLLKRSDYVKARGVMNDSDCFDASFFNYSPREAEIMDPQLRILHECAWAALEDAGYSTDSYEGSIGCYSGASSNVYWLKRFFSPGNNFSPADRFSVYTFNSFSSYGTRIAYKLNLRGPGFPVHTGCSTSLVNVHLACQGLLNNDCDIALAGGVSLMCPPKSGYIHQEGMLHSPDGHTRAFDSLAQGTIFGDAVAMIVLKPLEHALADGDSIHAVIKGSAINNDGNRRLGYTAPSTQGQAEVIRAAIRAAGIRAESIGYVETHGTGTRLGDPNEIEGLKRAFNTNKKGFCKIASLKTNVGHLDVAAGVSGIIKTVLSLKYKIIPPNLHFTHPNSEIDFTNSPFVVNRTVTEWRRGESDEPRRAGVSSFGIGGTNAHVILEEWPNDHNKTINSTGTSYPIPQLILLSAKTDTALTQATTNLVKYLERTPDINLSDLAYTLQVGRKAFKNRRMVVCSTAGEAIDCLSGTSQGKVQTNYLNDFSEDKNIVFMFSGQGSQYINMGLELYRSEPVFRKEMDNCLGILKPILGYDIKEILYPIQQGINVVEGVSTEAVSANQPENQRINQTEIVQPLLFVFEYSLAKLMMKWGIQPDAMIGHSIGEYVAACLSGVFSLEDALKITVSRGRLMQEMPAGAMLGVPLTEEEITPLLNSDIQLAAVNSQSNCVLSGDFKDISAVEKQLEGNGIRTTRIRTSHAFHSNMMAPILNRFKQSVESIQLNRPQIPYISNLSGNWITVEQATDPMYWANHILYTVRFADGINTLAERNNTIFIEVGPGRTLVTLVNKIICRQQDQQVVNLIRHPQEMVSDLYFLVNKIGTLWLNGVELDWQEYHRNVSRHRISLPTYPFERRFFWVQDKSVTQSGVNIDDDTGIITSTPVKNPNIADWFYIPSWKSIHSKKPDSHKNNTPGKWLIFSNKSEFNQKIATLLKQNNDDIVTVYPGTGYGIENSNTYTINPSLQEDYGQLIRDVLPSPDVPIKIAHLWNIDTADIWENNFEDFRKIQEHGFLSLLYLTQAIGNTGFNHNFQISVITSGMIDTIGNNGALPGKATIIGAIKVIPQEYPNIKCRCIDIDLPQPGSWSEKKLIKRLVTEFNSESKHPIMSIRGDQFLIPTVESIQLNENNASDVPFKQGGIYLITGGIGNIGLHVAEFLSKNWNAQVILTGRSTFPAREEWENWLNSHRNDDKISKKIHRLKQIENVGGEVLVARADTGRLEDMEALLTIIENRFGKLDGVLHAAGIAGEASMKSIKEMDREKCNQLFHPKINGLFVLDKILKRVEPDFCLLFSSISSFLGGIGLIAYSAANTFMDAFAQLQNKTSSFPWIAINWDLWRLEEQKQMLATGSGPGVNLLELSMEVEEGLEALKLVLSQQERLQIIVSTGHLKARISRWSEDHSGQDNGNQKEENSPLADASRKGLSVEYTPPKKNSEKIITGIWEEYFGSKGIGIHDNFFDLGATSLDLIRLNDRIKRVFKKDLAIEKLFTYPTIYSLAGFLDQSVNEGAKEIERTEVDQGELLVKGKNKLKRRKMNFADIEESPDA